MYEHGKIFVVTGASSGIGWALVKHLSAYPVKIAGIARTPERITEQWNQLDPAQVKAELLALRCDVAKENQVQETFHQIFQRFGAVDVLINNAGITHIRLFDALQNAKTEEVMRTNFFGAVYCTASAIASIVSRKGSIINISSVAGFAPLAGRTAYAASKHAMHGFFESLRTEVQSDGVQILMVCPTWVRTGIRQASETHLEVETLDADEVASDILRAWKAGKRFLLLGKTAKMAYYFNKFLPRIYENAMLKKQASLFTFKQNT